MDFKRIKAPSNTVTRNPAALSAKADSIYEAVAVVGRRANQISVEMKEELNRKLQEFASYADNLEEVFENREQIEISKFYEKIPKPVLIALQEFEEDEIYFRNPGRKTGNARGETNEPNEAV
ncbi:MAG: DNA-directed RNA polymerase subunit omega [Odoribacteraceae bacterium]|nr:DNA-directed RNA polymerase subunit omega [Odoribacteraceae bacterium]